MSVRAGFTFFFCSALYFAQVIPLSAISKTMFVAERSGLVLRAKPDKSASKLAIIPYGTQLRIDEDDKNPSSILIEGMQSTWAATEYRGKSGYIATLYLLPLPVPDAGCEDFECYGLQLLPANTIEESKRREEMLKIFGFYTTLHEGATCKSGFGISTTSLNTVQVQLLLRAIMANEFPGLLKPFLTQLTAPDKEGVRHIRPMQNKARTRAFSAEISIRDSTPNWWVRLNTHHVIPDMPASWRRALSKNTVRRGLIVRR